MSRLCAGLDAGIRAGGALGGAFGGAGDGAMARQCGWVWPHRHGGGHRGGDDGAHDRAELPRGGGAHGAGAAVHGARQPRAEIASCAAFQPIPYLAAYAATKAFLLRYSRALAAEVTERGITVTAICPYWIRDTEFIHEAKRTDKAGLFRGFPLATDQKTVARRSLWAAEHGFTVFTPDLVSTLHRIITSLLPHRLMIALSNIWRHLAG